MKNNVISILIGLAISIAISLSAYQFIIRKNQNNYIKSQSNLYDSLEIFQHRYDDLKLISQPFRTTQAKTALIAIDDASIEEIGRWPWSREIISKMTDELLKNGVKSVAFDIAFSESERENPKADEILGTIVEKNSDKIILGTAGTVMTSFTSPPYQDICRLEAFQYFGGDSLIKPNLTFIVDDETNNFETYKWQFFFKTIFDNLGTISTEQFYKNYEIPKGQKLDLFQRNALHRKIVRDANSYCDDWLTSNDIFLDKNNDEVILSLYSETIGKSLTKETLSSELEQIKKINPHPIQQYTDWLINVPLIQTPAQYTAGFNAAFDSSGLIRYYHLFNRIGFKIGSSYIPSLAMQMYLISENKRAEILISESTAKQEKYIKEFFIKDAEDDTKAALDLKVDEFARIRLNYLGGTNSFYYVSAKDLLNSKSDKIDVTVKDQSGQIHRQNFVKKDFFSNRSVLFGASALGIGDIRNTPVQIAMPGPETHLNAYANLVDKNYILDIKNPQIIIPVLTFLIGFAFTLVWTFASSLYSPVVLIISFFIGYFIDYRIFLSQKIMTTTWPLYFVCFISFMGIFLYKYFTEERSRQKIKKAFSKYVSPAVVEELLKNEKNLELGGKKQRLTVMFSDLRGFTTFSEKLDPEELTKFLNIYFTKMTEEVFNAKGTLDKFIGDAVMAFFGAPLSYQNNAENACRCALRSLERLQELNADFKQKGYPLLDMGIGINTGEMSVGNMGSETLQNYTVLGDSVNLASRLEGLNKDYGTKIIIGPETFKEINSIFVCRELDFVRVKGKKEALPIYELIDEISARSTLSDWLENYQQARRFYQSRDFNQAQLFFAKCVELKPTDQTSQLFIQRCHEYILNPPASDWDGVYNLDHK